MAIDELRTQQDEETFIIEADAAWKKANADKARIRALLAPKSFWQRVREFFGEH